MTAKLAVMRVDMNRETGEVILLMETACGFRPVMGWPDKRSLEDFAVRLLSICLKDDETATGPIEAI